MPSFQQSVGRIYKPRAVSWGQPVPLLRRPGHPVDPRLKVPESVTTPGNGAVIGHLKDPNRPASEASKSALAMGSGEDVLEQSSASMHLAEPDKPLRGRCERAAKRSANASLSPHRSGQ